MMYTAKATAAAGTNTDWDSAAKTAFRLTRVIIHQIDLEFPSGCAGLVQAAVLDHGHPLWPSDFGDTVRGDGVILSGMESYELDEEPFELELAVFSTDDTYDHTVEAHVYMLPKSAAQPWLAVTYALSRLQDSMDSLIAELKRRRIA